MMPMFIITGSMIMPAISSGYSRKHAFDRVEIAERDDDRETRDVGGNAFVIAHRYRATAPVRRLRGRDRPTPAPRRDDRGTCLRP